MREVVGGVVINEVETAPLSDYVIDFISSHRKECPYLDFKYLIPTSKSVNFPELAKDIFAFSNYGGGWIFIGWNEFKKNQFTPVGLPNDFQLESANLQEQFNSVSSEPITLDYQEFERDFRTLFTNASDELKKQVNSVSNRFAAIYIPPSHKIITPKTDGKYTAGEKSATCFRKDDILYRRGTQSIIASEYERELIKRRLEKENYRISVLSGEPDEIDETIYGNIFEITKLPRYVYTANNKGYDNVSIKALLKQEKVFPEWYHKFRLWNNKVVIFEDLTLQDNPYRKLILEETIVKENVEDWLKEPDKRRIIIELLNRELRHYAIKNGLFYFDKKNKLYYSTASEERSEKWKSRRGASTRVVAAKMYAEQIGRHIYWHTAFFSNVVEVNGKFYLRILPTFIITEDGKNPIFDSRIGTIITRLSYNKYNSSYLNTILFWIHQLGNGKSIEIKDYITISNKPVELKSNYGIIFDIPSSEFKLDIEEDEVILEDGEDTIDDL